MKYKSEEEIKNAITVRIVQEATGSTIVHAGLVLQSSMVLFANMYKNTPIQDPIAMTIELLQRQIMQYIVTLEHLEELNRLSSIETLTYGCVHCADKTKPYRYPARSHGNGSQP